MCGRHSFAEAQVGRWAGGGRDRGTFSLHVRDFVPSADSPPGIVRSLARIHPGDPAGLPQRCSWVPAADRPVPSAAVTAAGPHGSGALGPGGARAAVLFGGINPSLRSAEVGHHFARPGNRFWPALHAGRLHPAPRLVAVVGLAAHRTAFDRPQAAIGLQPDEIGGRAGVGPAQSQRPERSLQAADVARLYAQARAYDAMPPPAAPAPPSPRPPTPR